MDAMDGSKGSKAPANEMSCKLTLARLSRLCQECLCTWVWGGLLRGGGLFLCDEALGS